MTAIAGAESSYSNAIQKEQPYATTGWGTWQITPGNSVPSIAVDLALLDLVTNARAALVKCGLRVTVLGPHGLTACIGDTSNGGWSTIVP